MKKLLLLLYFINIHITLLAYSNSTEKTSTHHPSLSSLKTNKETFYFNPKTEVSENKPNNSNKKHNTSYILPNKSKLKASISEKKHNSFYTKRNSLKQKTSSCCEKHNSSKENALSSNINGEKSYILSKERKEHAYSFYIQNNKSFEREINSNKDTILLNKKNDKIHKKTSGENKQRYGIRLGIDISKPIRSIFDNKYKGLELVGDYRFNNNTYFAIELGSEHKNTHETYFDYTTQGQYIKIGADYNVYFNWEGMQNTIFVGGRYAVVRFEQEVTRYVPHTLNRYWEEEIVGTDKNILRTYKGRQAHFLELLVGMKVELLPNLYAGASIRLEKILYQDKNDFPNFYIPSFGRVWEGSTYGMSYNYTLSYMIPLKKK